MGCFADTPDKQRPREGATHQRMSDRAVAIKGKKGEPAAESPGLGAGNAGERAGNTPVMGMGGM